MILLNFEWWAKAVYKGWVYRKRIYLFGRWTPFVILYFDFKFKIKKIIRNACKRNKHN